MGRHYVRSARLPDAPKPGASRPTPARPHLRGAGGPRGRGPRSLDIPAELAEASEVVTTDYEALPAALSRPDVAALARIRKHLRDGRL